MTIDFTLLLSIVGWIALGLAIGGLSHALRVCRPPRHLPPDLAVARVLGVLGAVIGGTVGWSLSDSSDAMFVSFVGATLGALLLCVLFQFVVPV